ncbi:MAG: hypothetical protein MZW92_43175 [Comamonadaceae bacterium]|nr:hypothetical protein [Comamonadaceae bacterium]
MDAARPGPAAGELRARCRAQNGALRESAPAGSRNRSARQATRSRARARAWLEPSLGTPRLRLPGAPRPAARRSFAPFFRQARACRSRGIAAARPRPCRARAGSRSSRAVGSARRRRDRQQHREPDRRARARSRCRQPPASSHPGNGRGATTRAALNARCGWCRLKRRAPAGHDAIERCSTRSPPHVGRDRRPGSRRADLPAVRGGGVRARGDVHRTCTRSGR